MSEYNLLPRSNPIDKARNAYIEGGIADSRIPFRVYDRRFTEERYGRFKDVGGDVADVGCGHKPFPWANRLVDRDPFGDEKKEYNKGVPGIIPGSGNVLKGVKTYSLADGRVFYAVDIERQELPFENKRLDYLYSNQTIEHLGDPSFALEEMKRSAKGGCLRWPGREFELLYSNNGPGPEKTHKWIIEAPGSNLLRFRRMTPQEMQFREFRKSNDDPISYRNHFPPVISKVYRALDKGHDCRDTNEFHWKDGFDFEVIDSGNLSEI
jgi:SAM-dependent methyltransferase